MMEMKSKNPSELLFQASLGFAFGLRFLRLTFATSGAFYV
jgi:hypothetical protein